MEAHRSRAAAARPGSRSCPRPGSGLVGVGPATTLDSHLSPGSQDQISPFSVAQLHHAGWAPGGQCDILLLLVPPCQHARVLQLVRRSRPLWSSMRCSISFGPVLLAGRATVRPSVRCLHSKEESGQAHSRSTTTISGGAPIEQVAVVVLDTFPVTDQGNRYV